MKKRSFRRKRNIKRRFKRRFRMFKKMPNANAMVKIKCPQTVAMVDSGSSYDLTSVTISWGGPASNSVTTVPMAPLLSNNFTDYQGIYQEYNIYGMKIIVQPNVAGTNAAAIVFTNVEFATNMVSYDAYATPTKTLQLRTDYKLQPITDSSKHHRFYKIGKYWKKMGCPWYPTSATPFNIMAANVSNTPYTQARINYVGGSGLSVGTCTVIWYIKFRGKSY